MAVVQLEIVPKFSSGSEALIAPNIVPFVVLLFVE